MKIIREETTIELPDMPIKELAKALGVTRMTIWNWQNGKAFPWPKHRQKLKELSRSTS